MANLIVGICLLSMLSSLTMACPLQHWPLGGSTSTSCGSEYDRTLTAQDTKIIHVLNDTEGLRTLKYEKSGKIQTLREVNDTHIEKIHFDGRVEVKVRDGPKKCPPDSLWRHQSPAVRDYECRRAGQLPCDPLVCPQEALQPGSIISEAHRCSSISQGTTVESYCSKHGSVPMLRLSLYVIVIVITEAYTDHQAVFCTYALYNRFLDPFRFCCNLWHFNYCTGL